ncbi:hypothetical protein DI137_00020 [Legionella pneumophila]|nr:hypothetical protein [Legionella pneumophila]TIH05331.1 hypothetical protein DI137_00020 [Legionella pneumophila]BCZ98086.1 hypothetical protein LEG80045_23420 [Legionella pneumophila]VEB31305.1 Uncharacterised protein [Legionella pneumophila]HAU0160496.1 hypothetical protein [Legionella pneumophila]
MTTSLGVGTTGVKGEVYYEKGIGMTDLIKILDDYFNKARELESYTINDLEKHLWLVNASSATITIGFIQSKDGVGYLQILGAWSFVLGIISLLLMKFVSAINSSRDKKRFVEATLNISAENAAEKIREIKDKQFSCLRMTYLILQYGAGVLFIVGCILTILSAK